VLVLINIFWGCPYGLPAAGRVGLSALVPPKYGATPLQSLTHRNTKGIAYNVTKKEAVFVRKQPLLSL